ncbi:MAG TPA: kelch repeat-containing protein [Pirellulales bacterium]|jgi:N-acetylneuraminic acid mutarotase|nr:kelch repeat-containing protein [Pirellulales bacterium]
MHRPLLLVVIGAGLALASGAWADDSQPAASGGKEFGNLQWKAATPTPFPRVESPTVVVDGKLFLFGGFTDDLGASRQLDVYDPATDTWTRRKDMPTGVTHLNPAIDGNNIWLAGGFKGRHPGPVTDEVWKYDVAEDSWTPGPRLPEPRAGGGLAIAGHKLHYFGGYKSDRDTDSADHWTLALEGGAAWQHEADLPEARGHVAAAALDGKVYALGGDHGHDVTQIDKPACHVYDPAVGGWRAIASLPDGRSHFESSTIIYRGGILIVGGRSNSPEPPRGVLNELLLYDPHADAWQRVGSLPENVLAPSAAIVGNRIVVTAGGLNNPRPLTAKTWVATIGDR